MALYRIIDITEADYGCEEHFDGPHAILKLEDGSSVEVTEKLLQQLLNMAIRYLQLSVDMVSSKICGSSLVVRWNLEKHLKLHL